MTRKAARFHKSHELLAAVRRKETALIDLIRELTLAESPSDDKTAVDACMAIVAARAKALGGRLTWHRQDAFGDLLEVRFGPEPPGARADETGAAIESRRRVLLLGHLDTVWPVGTLKSMPCRLADGRLCGPGTLDMKAGVAMALTAIEALREAGSLQREVVLLLTSEEEIGSPVSRPVTERLASECCAVFVLEPAQGLAVKTARKGHGVWRVEVRGVAAHAGVDFGKGSSAIRELARIVETVSGWTDLRRGLTVNVGRIGGGSKVNVVPAEAWAEVDVRIARSADGERIERKFAALRAMDKACSIVVSGGIGRPPMVRTPGTARLFRQAKALAAQLGFALEEAATGGASDGNFTSAMGIPTLDGLGAVGEGAHASHESILVEHLVPRTALLAGLLAG